MLSALAFVALAADPVVANTSAVPFATVFVTPADPVADRGAGRLEVDLSAALAKRNVRITDLDALFPQPRQPRDEGELLIKEGKEAYDNLDLDTAIRKLTDGALFFVKHPELTEPHQLAEAFLFLGAAELQNGSKTSAKEFARAAVLDPTLVPDPRFFASDVQKAFTAAKKEVDARPKGLVLFESAPSGAQLELLGKPRGLTPLDTMELHAGRYHVRARRPGYVTAARFPEISGGDELVVKLELNPLPAFAAHVDLAHRLTTRATFDSQIFPTQAFQLGQALQTRFLVLVMATGQKGKDLTAEAQVWDIERGDRLREIKFVVNPDGIEKAAETITRWVDRPAPVAVSDAKPSALSGVLKKPWFWVAAGVVVAGAATAVAVAASPGPHRFDHITGIP